MFTAYFDASGTQHDQPVLVVAGFIALEEQWLEIGHDWDRRLRQDGLERFHMSEVNRAFKREPSRRRKLLEDLAAIIEVNANRKFGCCVVNSAITSMSQSDQERWHINAYSLAGRSCAGQVRRWAQGWGARCLPKLVFERGDHGRGELIKSLRRDGFQMASFEEKHLVPLQAADLFAYSVFEPLRKIEQDGHIAELPWLHDLFRRIPGDARYFGVEGMEDLKRSLAETNLIQDGDR